jgi:hypothetical protein
MSYIYIAMKTTTHSESIKGEEATTNKKKERKRKSEEERGCFKKK